MPSFQQYLATGAASGTVRAAIPSGADVSGLVSGVERAADSMQRLRQHNEMQAQQLAQDEAAVQVINAQTRLQNRARERMQEFENSPDGMPGSTAKLLKEFDSWASEEEGAVSETAKPKLRVATARMRGVLNEHAYNAEIGFRTKKLVGDFESGLDEDRRLVYANPAAFTDALARRTALANTLTIPEELKQKLRARSGESLALGAAQSLADNTPQQLLDRAGNGDPAKAEKAVASDPILSKLSPEALRATMHAARTELSRRAAEGRFDVVIRTKDVQSMILSGVPVPEGIAPTVEDYTKLHGASGPAMWQQEVGNFLQIGGAIQQMRTASAVEREQIVAGQQPAAGAGFAGAAQMAETVKQARALVEKQIVSDPATYALTTSPRVQKFATAMQTVMSLPASNPNATPEDRAAVVDAYAKAMEAEQLRLGVNTIRDEVTGNKLRGPKLLTNQQANAISDMFHDQTQGGANAAQLIQGLEQQWGKHWPKVYGQLAADNKLPPAALVIPSMPNDASRSRMAQVSALKPAELEALIAPGEKKDINEKVRGAFEDAQRTFTAQGVAGGQTLAVVMEQAEKLAMLYRSQGKSVGDAAKQAYTETMGHAYNFADTYRVPVKFDSKQIRSGADAAVDALAKSGEATVFTGQAPEKLTEDAVRFRSMWITNADESGLELRLRGADGGVYAVHGKDGKPIVMPWADLTTRAKTFKAVDDTGEGTTEWMRRRQQDLNPRR